MLCDAVEFQLGWLDENVHDSLQREQKKETTNIKQRNRNAYNETTDGMSKTMAGASMTGMRAGCPFSYLADRFVFRPASPGWRQGTPRSCCRLSASLQSPLQISNAILGETPRHHSHNQSIRCTRIRDSFDNDRHDTTSLYANRLMADGSEE
jgi:hypothetical protein